MPFAHIQSSINIPRYPKNTSALLDTPHTLFKISFHAAPFVPVTHMGDGGSLT